MVELSAVVQLIDGVTGQPAEGVAATFTLDDVPAHPFAKPQAFYAFADLASGRYRLGIRTSVFLPFTTSVTVPMALPLADGILPCTLEPAPFYPYEDWQTLIRGRVSRQRKPVAGATVTASRTGRGGRTVTRSTRTWTGGVYDGRYALALGAPAEAGSDVTLTVTAPDGSRHERPIRITPRTTTVVDIDLA